MVCRNVGDNCCYMRERRPDMGQDLVFQSNTTTGSGTPKHRHTRFVSSTITVAPLCCCHIPFPSLLSWPSFAWNIATAALLLERDGGGDRGMGRERGNRCGGGGVNWQFIMCWLFHGWSGCQARNNYIFTRVLLRSSIKINFYSSL